jgi:predicted aldo/keto reductase-like oxidoreductase
MTDTKDERKQLRDDVINANVSIEFSHQDAHWKANRKMILNNLFSMCKQCEFCEGDKCPLHVKIRAALLKTRREG